MARKDCKGKTTFSILQAFLQKLRIFPKNRHSFQVSGRPCGPARIPCGMFCDLVKNVDFSNADAKVATKSELANIFLIFFRKIAVSAELPGKTGFFRAIPILYRERLLAGNEQDSFLFSYRPPVGHPCCRYNIGRICDKLGDTPHVLLQR